MGVADRKQARHGYRVTGPVAPSRDNGDGIGFARGRSDRNPLSRAQRTEVQASETVSPPRIGIHR